MRIAWIAGFLAALWPLGSAPLHAAIEVAPVASGLSSPTFVTHAGDGSRRLFVVEQPGVIRVLHPGTGAPTAFLDIRARVLAGGERGLLGLAFHPDYSANGRFFVYYTRAGDGALVIAQYGVSTDPNVASATEAVLLTIPHPTNANHNGGMLAFGRDGYLYVGVGDGGSGNDPPNNAQNLDVLLGKILRIDVDRADPVTGAPYASPPDNPFVGAPGRDEVFAFGLRNPWRFSFDRLTGVQWVADVGQGAHEEVDMPIEKGGNYGWRVYEGFACTGNDPSRCDPDDFRFPLFDYAHDHGRCSITGGYVYRGSRGVVPNGTYVYGDYCTGEIFAWNGSRQSVLLDTAANVSSFGEDEDGELLVVDLGGSVGRLVPAIACTYAITPMRATFLRGGGAGSVAITTAPGCAWTAVSSASWISLGAQASATGSGSLTYAVAPYAGQAKYRDGTLTIAGRPFTIRQSKVQLARRNPR